MSGGPRGAVLCQTRTGSTWLMDLLAHSRPDAMVTGEIFIAGPVPPRPQGQPGVQIRRDFPRYVQCQERLRSLTPNLYLSRLEAAAPRGLLFKLMYVQAYSHPSLVPTLVARRYRLCQLVRRNLLDAVLSQATLLRTRRAHAVVDDGWTPAAITVDPQAVIASIHRRRRYDRIVAVTLAGLPVSTTRVVYEDLVDDPGGELARLSEFFGFVDPSAAVTSPLAKTGPEDLRQRVTNAEELVAALRSAGLEHYLR